MMNWFEAEVSKAADQQQKVWVLGHIPAGPGTASSGGEYGSGYWYRNHTLRYLALVERYSDVITGQFYGHVHEDYVQITRACRNITESSTLPHVAGAGRTHQTVCDGAPTGVAWMGPSLTEGWPSMNPAIRQYEFSTESFVVEESHTFWTNLTAGNAAGRLTWGHEYAATTQYGMPDVTGESWARAFEAMAGNWSQFQRHYDLRRRLYRGPLSASSGTACTNLGCAEPIICALRNFDPVAANACFRQSSSYERHDEEEARERRTLRLHPACRLCVLPRSARCLAWPSQGPLRPCAARQTSFTVQCGKITSSACNPTICTTLRNQPDLSAVGSFSVILDPSVHLWRSQDP